MSANTNVRQSVGVTVNTAERSVTFVANTMFQVLFRIATGRGLSPDYITRNREVIENGLFTWLAEQTLQRAYLEVFLSGHSQAIERWEFEFTYIDTPEAGAKQPPVAELAELCGILKALPRRAEYRVVVQTSPGATKVPGWKSTNLRSMGRCQSQELQAWGYGNISTKVTFRGDW